MVRYWAIAPAEYAERGPKRRHFDRCWQYDRDNGIMAVVWDVGAPRDRNHLKVLYAAADKKALEERNHYFN